METLYTLEEVSKILKVARITLERWEKTNKLNVIRINGHPRVKQSELERLLKGGSK